MELSIVGTMHSESVHETEEGAYVETTVYGYRAWDAHPLASLHETADNDCELYLGEYKVKDYDFNTFEAKIPVYYCVRTLSHLYEGFYEFVCGLDLLRDGRVWVGKEDEMFDNIKDAIQHVQNIINKECCIFIEDQMIIHSY